MSDFVIGGDPRVTDTTKHFKPEVRQYVGHLTTNGTDVFIATKDDKNWGRLAWCDGGYPGESGVNYGWVTANLPETRDWLKERGVKLKRPSAMGENFIFTAIGKGTTMTTATASASTTRTEGPGGWIDPSLEPLTENCRNWKNNYRPGDRSYTYVGQCEGGDILMSAKAFTGTPGERLVVYANSSPYGELTTNLEDAAEVRNFLADRGMTFVVDEHGEPVLRPVTAAVSRVTPIPATGYGRDRSTPGENPTYLGTIDETHDVVAWDVHSDGRDVKFIVVSKTGPDPSDWNVTSGDWKTLHKFNEHLKAARGDVEVRGTPGAYELVDLHAPKEMPMPVKTAEPKTVTNTTLGATLVLTGHPTEKAALHLWESLSEVVEKASSRGLYCILYGPPGTGKTTLANTLATKRNKKHIPITLDQDMYSQSLIGQYVPQANKRWEFQYGPLAEAYLNGHISSLNEINCASGGVLTMLYQVLDDRGVSRLVTPEKVLEPHEGFYAIATTNVPIEELAIPEALLSRFPVRIGVDYPNPAAVSTLKLEGLRRLTWEVYTRTHDLYRKVDFRQIRALDHLLDAGLSRSSAVQHVFPNAAHNKLITSALAVASA